MKYASGNVAVLMGGVDLTPALAESIAHSIESITQQTNPFGTSNEAHTPVNMVKGSLAIGGGLFDEAVDTIHAGVSDSGLGASRGVCICEQGQTKGKHFTGYEGVYSTKYDVLDTNGAITKANITVVVTGLVEDGEIIQELAAQTADWNTTAAPVDRADDSALEQIPITSSSLANPSVITTPYAHGLVTNDVVAIFTHVSVAPDINDSGVGAWQYVGHTVTVISPTSFSIPVNVTDAGTGGYLVVVERATGGYGHLQVTAGSGFTNFVGTIKHSVDAAVWVALVTFADTVGDFSTAQRVATATATTRVRRYLAFDGNVTGVGSITVFSGFARGR